MITAYNLHNGKVLCKKDLILWPRLVPSGVRVKICDSEDLEFWNEEFKDVVLIDSYTFAEGAKSNWVWRNVSAQPGVSKNGTVWYWSSEVPDDINEALTPIFKEIDEDYMARLKALNERQTKRLIALHDFIKEY